MGKVRVIFMFMREGAAGPGVVKRWDKTRPCAAKYTNKNSGVYTEGIFYMLSRMLQTKIIDELLVFFESNRGAGYADWGDGVKGYVIPELSFINEYIRENDIIFVRGGFKTWHNWLVDKKKKGHWLLTYNANTGRQRWKFWDVIFWDIKELKQMDRHGRIWFYYKKPTRPDLFHPIWDIKPKYDICVGASYIHDKKGQWRTINTLIAYKRLFGRNLKAIMPGAPRRGVKSNHIRNLIKKHALDIDVVSMLPRSEMAAKVYNQSKIFVHLGMSGQNDRGPLEALACGTPVVIGAPNYHSPVVWRDTIACWIPPNREDYDAIARELHLLVEEWNEELKKYVVDYYANECDIEDVILPEMKTLFDFIRENPVRDKKAKQELTKLLFGDTS